MTRLEVCGVGIAFAVSLLFAACFEDTSNDDGSGAVSGGGSSDTDDGGDGEDGSDGTSGTAPPDDGSTGTDSGDDGGDTAPSCDEGGEPNDSEDTAVDLGAIGDCDEDGSTTSGELAGAGDVDWFVYEGQDIEPLCIVDPGAWVNAGSEVRLCMFPECLSGEPGLSGCPDGATEETSPDGVPGCCVFGDASSMVQDAECSGADDSMFVFMRIDRGPVELCTDYTLEYRF